MRVLEIFQVGSVWIIHPKRCVELQFIRGPVFQLRPAADRVQASPLSAGQCGIAAKQCATSNSAAQSPKALSAIQLPTQRKLAAERQFDICHPGSAIHGSAETVILPAIEPSHAHPQGLSENIVRPCYPCAIRRLTRQLPRPRLPVETSLG